jgi:hypothetical protein
MNKISMKQHLNMKKILNSLALCAIMLLCAAVHGQNPADDCMLIKEVLNHNFFQSTPFSLVDTIYVYEKGEKRFADCDVFGIQGGKFYYTWEKVAPVVIRDSASLHDGKYMKCSTDSGTVYYKTSLLITVYIKQGKQSWKSVEDKSLHPVRHLLSSYRKYSSVWISWSERLDSSVCMTFKKKKGGYVLVSVGQS